MNDNDNQGPALPPGLDLLWGVRDRPARRPRAGLSLERIVQAGIEIADAEGLAPLSMARVAERLGFTTMSLYRHVTSKDELLMLMVNTATAPPPGPWPTDGDWRARLTHWSREQLVICRRHPWVLRVPISGPPASPSSLTWMDRGLAALAGTGLGPGERLGVIQLVSGYVRTEAQLFWELAEGEAAAVAAGESPPVGSYGQLLAKLIDAEHYPALFAVVASGIFDEPVGPVDGELQADFEFGLERVLDGIEVLIKSRADRAG